jgi:hypothetical protein
MAAASTNLCLVPSEPSKQNNFATLEQVKISLISILVAWATVFTVGRLYANIRKLFLGDYFTLIALIISIVILAFMSTQYETEQGNWDEPECYFDESYAAWVSFPPCYNRV